VRTGTFVRGAKVVYSRIEIGAMPAPGVGLLRIRFTRPNGSTAAESRMTLRTAHGRGYWWFANRVTLGRLGRWRIVVDLDGRTLADAPINVVARQAEVENRPPNAISVSLRPEARIAQHVVECRVSTSLVREDPDLDIVRYRYRWFVDGKLVRAVQSAALTDVLRKGLARPGRSVRCAVTPSDGRLSGPTATAR
jgi:hypothetical protein